MRRVPTALDLVQGLRRTSTAFDLVQGLQKSSTIQLAAIAVFNILWLLSCAAMMMVLEGAAEQERCLEV